MTHSFFEKDEFRIVFGSSKIDYDQNKELINREKHKYSLESAVYLLEQIVTPFNCRPYINRDVSADKEIRHEHMTIDDEGKVVFMVTTMREDETIRIISLRRAKETERSVFMSHTGYKEPDTQQAAHADADTHRFHQ